MAGRISFSRREQYILFVLLGILAAFGVYRYGYVPSRDKMRMIDGKIQRTRMSLVKSARVVERASRFYEKKQPLLEIIVQQGSDEKVMSGMLSSIERVAREIGVRVADLKPRRVKARDFYNQFSVSLTIEGDMMDILKFIHSLQGPDYGFKVEEIEIRRRSSRVKDLRCQMVLSHSLISG